ncbi:LysR family transcriptional regulator [Mesorhizobium sp. CA8]|uniref:LysR substrate-binding domain-containing protein n=1 Tax=unclassified Mesorhizobium TaxID=325217 RepID=UPI001CC97E10|nr:MULTISPECIES: LysR substrate-binding domain-containing protein [unclassified Mesorhizobium]MBZ9764974.1 LysR family transcriptional regulator [Mesorhizobium sp. CA8]MBZ9823622.1 LysR family transcriptional regulator [Mesorhizobium sp. CA4]
MSGLRSKIPSPQSLFAFLAAAKTRNFGRAAEDLNVTQSSISHSIRKLERHLGTQLFIRANRGVSMTPDGQLLFRAVSGGFAQIEDTIDAIGKRELGFVSVAASTSMATYWLMPQLRDFHKMHPGIKLKILTIDKDVEPDDAIDLTIRLLPLTTDRKNAWLMAKETVFPVCSRAYLAESPPLNDVSDLLNHKLLSYEDPNRRRINWPEFYAALQMTSKSIEPTVVFNDYQLVLQAAMAGEGIAIGWSMTNIFLLEQGQLCRPLPVEVTTQNGFYVLAQPGKMLRKHVRTLVDWLLKQSQALR